LRTVFENIKMHCELIFVPRCRCRFRRIILLAIIE